LLTNAQIEAQVLGIFDVVKSGAKYEDALVELKADWPSPERAARRIAGHANAARGGAILWIVGLDETNGVGALTAVDLADWWAQVQRCFDGPAPDLRDLVVQTPDGPIHALHFDVARSPYVVKNPTFGSAGSGPIEREVPWREGTALRTARREDLVRLLVPVLRLPEVEILDANVIGRESSDSRTSRMEADDPNTVEQMFDLYMNLEMYVTPPRDELVVLPVHRTSVTVRLGADGATCAVGNCRYATPAWGAFNDKRVDSVSVETTSSEAIVHLPGRLILNGHFVREFRDVLHSEALTIVYAVQPVHADLGLQTEVKLVLARPERDGEMKWGLASQRV
jgi:hypothetical protein